MSVKIVPNSDIKETNSYMNKIIKLIIILLLFSSCEQPLPRYELEVWMDTPEAGSISVQPLQRSYESGSIVTLIPMPNPDWEFIQWKGNIPHSTADTLRIRINSDMVIKAEFSKWIYQNSNSIRFIFDEGLNDDIRFRLQKDKNGYYELKLNETGSTIQRISARLLDGDVLLNTPSSGNRHHVRWSNNLYWWISEGDGIAQITKTYFNPFTGELQWVNLPPLISQQNAIVPTINQSSISNGTDGRVHTVISPISYMAGDTMVVRVWYDYTMTKKLKDSNFYIPIGKQTVMDSVRIILK